MHQFGTLMTLPNIGSKYGVYVYEIDNVYVTLSSYNVKGTVAKGRHR